MISIELIVLLLAVAAALQVLARRINVPQPVLLVLGGVVLAVIPGLPRPAIDPELIFLVFVPPLLYWSALTTSLRDLRAQRWPIIRLATALVLVTIAAVAATARWIAPEFTWGAAFVLGAIVSPPDPIAASAVTRTLGVPRSITSLLEGEGLVNDATALVCYQMGVAAVVTGSFSLGETAVRFILTGVGGVAIGLIVGWLIAWLRTRLESSYPIVENTLSLLTPFIAYLPAAVIGASGVLSVVTVGLYLGRRGPHIVQPATRMQSEAMWTMLQFLLESLIFILIGLELPAVLAALRGHSAGTLAWYAGAVTIVCIAVRAIWVFSAVWRLRRRGSHEGKRPTPTWPEATFVAWAGIRGGDSLVIALALPLVTRTGAPFPARDLIIFVTFGVIFATLVVQGLTLRSAVRVLGLHADDGEEREELRARREALRAGLARLDALAREQRFPPRIIEHLRRHYETRLQSLPVDGDGSPSPPRTAADRSASARAAPTSEMVRDVRRQLIAAERDTVVRLRDEGAISDDVMRHLQRELDLESMLLDSAEADSNDSPYLGEDPGDEVD